MATSIENLPQDTVWLVTGCSPGGLGGSFCKAILEAGYKLIATARSLPALTYLSPSPRLLTLTLDVTNTAQIKSVFEAAVGKFGHVDIVINNAGYTHAGDTEAITQEDAHKLMDVDFWGVVNVTKEAVRVFRESNGLGKGGLVVQVGSIGGLITFPGNAYYHASKFGVEGFTESMSKEMPSDWNINFLILEPGAIATEFAKSSYKSTPPHPAYANPNFPSRQLERWMFQNTAQLETMAADPETMAKIVVDTISKRGNRPLPLRLPLGAGSVEMIKNKMDSQKKDMDDWNDVSISVMTELQRNAAEEWAKSI